MSSMATYQNLLIHGPVELGNGWHRKKRHLFLFRDYLLISNTRCKNILKIKCVIPLHIVWMDKVEEGDSEAKKSFLLGWPMENFRATFPSLEQKEKWCSFLERNINLTKEKDNQKTLELPIFIKDIQHSPVAVTATSFDTVNDIIKKTLSIIGITECENEYLLSFNSGKEEAPFTLLGKCQGQSKM
uniref:Rho GTPase-activating protein 20-like n=1 Tax=Castor canadensis TaxID=51338 RepID=A0A8B7UES2_CASCN|nr:rho GTPase-activating protein 20-like [Castor canadensis]